MISIWIVFSCVIVFVLGNLLSRFNCFNWWYIVINSRWFFSFILRVRFVIDLWMFFFWFFRFNLFCTLTAIILQDFILSILILLIFSFLLLFQKGRLNLFLWLLRLLSWTLTYLRAISKIIQRSRRVNITWLFFNNSTLVWEIKIIIKSWIFIRSWGKFLSTINIQNDLGFNLLFNLFLLFKSVFCFFSERGQRIIDIILKSILLSSSISSIVVSSLSHCLILILQSLRVWMLSLLLLFSALPESFNILTCFYFGILEE